MFGYCAGNPSRVCVSASPSSGDDRQPDSTAVPEIDFGSQAAPAEPDASAPGLPDAPGAGLPSEPPPVGDGLEDAEQAVTRRAPTVARDSNFERMCTSQPGERDGRSRHRVAGPRGRTAIPP